MLNLGNSKQVVDEAMAAMSKRILDSCASIQNLCKNFNLVDELNITLQQLETEAGLLTSFAAKKQAEEFIAQIKSLIDVLSKQADDSKKRGGRGDDNREREQKPAEQELAPNKPIPEKSEKPVEQELVPNKPIPQKSERELIEAELKKAEEEKRKQFKRICFVQEKGFNPSTKKFGKQ